MGFPKIDVSLKVGCLPYAGCWEAAVHTHDESLKKMDIKLMTMMTMTITMIMMKVDLFFYLES